MLSPPPVEGPEVPIGANGDSQELLVTVRPDELCIAGSGQAEDPPTALPELPSSVGTILGGAVARRCLATPRRGKEEFVGSPALGRLPEPDRVGLRDRSRADTEVRPPPSSVRRRSPPSRNTGERVPRQRRVARNGAPPRHRAGSEGPFGNARGRSGSRDRRGGRTRVRLRS